MSKKNFHGRRNTQARSAKQVTRRKKREAEQRVQDAQAEVQANQAKIENLASINNVGAAVGAQYADQMKKILAPEPPPKPPRKYRNPHLYFFDKRKVDRVGTDESVDAISTARRLLNQGYRIDSVMKRTGVGYDWLDDLPIGTDGRIPEHLWK